MTVTRQIEHELLLSALDEDAVLSAAENIIAKMNGVELRQVLALATRLAESGVIALYKYDNDQSPVAIRTKEFSDEMHSTPHEVFLQSTEDTSRRLSELSHDKSGFNSS